MAPIITISLVCMIIFTGEDYPNQGMDLGITPSIWFFIFLFFYDFNFNGR